MHPGVLLVTAVVAAAPPPRLRISEGGAAAEYYLATTAKGGAPRVSDNSTAVEVAAGERYYLMSAPRPHSSPNRSDFKLFQLAEKKLQVTVDLKGAGCGCKVALYLVAMPAAAPGAGGDWYCDAGGGGGGWCPEVDLTEMNTRAVHTTMHHCSQPYNSTSCDKAGHGVRFGQGASDVGAGSGFTINTEEPFDMSFHFRKVGAKTPTLSLEVELLQETRSTSKTVGNASDVWGPLAEGMVLALSLVASTDMKWLDSPPCASDPAKCPAYSTLSNFRVS